MSEFSVLLRLAGMSLYIEHLRYSKGKLSLGGFLADVPWRSVEEERAKQYIKP